MPSWCSAPQAADVAHPAFSKMFVRTEYVPRQGALIANRRRRAPDEPEVWASHHAVVEGTDRRGSRSSKPIARASSAADASCARRSRCSRAARCRAPRAPCSIAVFALRYRIRVPAGGTARIAFWTCVGAQPQPAARTRRQTSRRQRAHARLDAGVDAGAGAAAPPRHRCIAGQSLPAARGTHPVREPDRARVCGHIRRGAAGPAALWSQGISGDLPIVLLRVKEADDLVLVRQLLQAHEYWGIKRLSVDLVILNERGASYVQDLQMALEAAVRTSLARPRIAGTDSARQGVRAAHRSHHLRDPRIVVSRRARGVVRSTRHPRRPGGAHCNRPPPWRPGCRAARSPRNPPLAEPDTSRKLEFFNGLGGFDAQGREYVVQLARRRNPRPCPGSTSSRTRGSGFRSAATAAATRGRATAAKTR